jgi:predicted pyridoxine 5'-phosphate oxidase superfamily flavin-nucleotide-binding protein
MEEASESNESRDWFHEGSRTLQERFGTRPLADRITEKFVRDRLDDGDRGFVERADMLFLATADAQGRPSCSYKGGDPGFVTVVDPATLAFPNYDGNGMFLSWGNTLANPAVGLLFIDFERGHRLRVNGTATIDVNDELLAAYPGAQFIVRVAIRDVFPNCPRYIHRYRLVERSTYVPRGRHPVPEPDWKREDWAVDVLPAPAATSPAPDVSA